MWARSWQQRSKRSIDATQEMFYRQATQLSWKNCWAGIPTTTGMIIEMSHNLRYVGRNQSLLSNACFILSLVSTFAQIKDFVDIKYAFREGFSLVEAARPFKIGQNVIQAAEMNWEDWNSGRTQKALWFLIVCRNSRTIPTCRRYGRPWLLAHFAKHQEMSY